MFISFLNRPRVLQFTFFIFLFTAACGGGGGGGGQTSNSDLSTNSCSALGLSPRILFGGACDSSFSPVVKISIAPENDFADICTGTMITPFHVLTAGHCVPNSPQGVTVQAGNDVFPAERIFVHPNYEIREDLGAIINDVAIIQLSQAVRVPTLPIVVSQARSPGEILDFFGYGVDEAGRAGVLKSGQMELQQVTEDHLFFAFNGNGINTCTGDSGGPALATVGNGIGVAGIVSTGSQERCGTGDVSLLTNVFSPSVQSFILSVAPTANTI